MIPFQVSVSFSVITMAHSVVDRMFSILNQHSFIACPKGGHVEEEETTSYVNGH